MEYSRKIVNRNYKNASKISKIITLINKICFYQNRSKTTKDKGHLREEANTRHEPPEKPFSRYFSLYSFTILNEVLNKIVDKWLAISGQHIINHNFTLQIGGCLRTTNVAYDETL